MSCTETGDGPQEIEVSTGIKNLHKLCMQVQGLYGVHVSGFFQSVMLSQSDPPLQTGAAYSVTGLM